MHDCQLGLPAAGDDPHHAVSLRETLRARTKRGDLAGQLEPRDVLRSTRRCRVEPSPLEHVGAVEAGCPHPHEHLARPRGGIRVLGDVSC